MTTELTSIKTAYEQEGMTVEEIAEDRAMEPIAVKAALMQSSALYRKACGQESEEDTKSNFTEDEERRIREMIVSIALGAEDDSVRLKAAMYVRDDFKGRKEVVRAVQKNTFNILDFNEAMKSARSGASKLKETFGSGQRKVIPV
jgi:hypothetical protein